MYICTGSYYAGTKFQIAADTAFSLACKRRHRNYRFTAIGTGSTYKIQLSAYA